MIRRNNASTGEREAGVKPQRGQPGKRDAAVFHLAAKTLFSVRNMLWFLLMVAAVYYSTRTTRATGAISKPPAQHISHIVRSIAGARRWKWNKVTLSSFEVAGVDLGLYGLGGEEETMVVEKDKEPFELFDDFNLADQLTGNEGWEELNHLRRDTERPSLSFYVDKIARKRWLPSVGLAGSKSFVMKYASELTESGSLDDERKAILNLLPPKGTDYVAKPNHLSCSGGVWILKNVVQHGGNVTLIGHGNRPLEPVENFELEQIADDLAENLHETAECHGGAESWALKNVKPGILVEERFTAYGKKMLNKGGMEFKVFTIWGRVWICCWRPGTTRIGAWIVRNGTNLEWGREGRGGRDSLPSWVDWQRIVDIAEQLGKHKDMFRTDIFVGIPADSPALRDDATREEQLAAVQYVVSECEVHPTTSNYGGTEDIFAEGARLWLAGYMIGNYKVVPDTEVPPEYLENGMLAENELLLSS